jgi:hypothetical protein
MTYALNLADDSRILSSCVVLPNGSYDSMTVVDKLPGGETDEEKNINNWRFVDGEYVFDPLPNEEKKQPRTTEERLSELEEAFQMILSGGD